MNPLSARLLTKKLIFQTMSKQFFTSKRTNQHLEYILVLDFEATCDFRKQIIHPEIIEFPVICLNLSNLETTSIFHSYVKPSISPKLTTFCTQLTGITQEQVDNSPHFDIVMQNFNQWMIKDVHLVDASGNMLRPFTFVTSGNWDLGRALPLQCRLLNIISPEYMKSWCNCKKAFAEIKNSWPKGLSSMIEQLGLQQIGHAHSGIDDCKNIINVMKSLITSGYVVRSTDIAS